MMKLKIIILIIMSSLALVSNGQLSIASTDSHLFLNSPYYFQDTVRANELLDEAENLSKTSKKKEAIEKAEAAKKLFSEADNIDTLKIVKCLNVTGATKIRMGDVNKARTDYEEVILLMNAFDPKRPEKLKALVNIAITYYREQNVELTLKILDELKPLAYEDLNQNQGLTISMHITYGNAYLLIPDYQQAIYHFNKAIALADKFPVRRMKVYANLGTLYLQMEEYDQSIKNFNTALKILQEEIPENKNMIASLLINLSINYDAKGDFQKAIDAVTKGLSLYLESPADYQPNLINAYICLGNPYIGKGETKKGVGAFLNAEALTKKYFGEEHSFIPIIYSNIGSGYYKSGDLDLSLEYYKKSEKLQMESEVNSGSTLAIVCSNIGMIYIDKSNYDSASYYIQRGLDYGMQHFSEESIAVADAYSGLGILNMRKKEFEAASNYFNKVLAIRQSIFGTQSVPVAKSHILLLMANKATKDFEGAKQHLLKAYKSLNYRGPNQLNEVSSNVELLEVFNLELSLYLEQYEINNNKNLLKDAYFRGKEIESAISQLLPIIDPYQGSTTIMKFHNIYEKLIKINFLLQKEALTKDLIDEAFHFSESAKGLLLSLALTQSDALRFSNIPAKLVAREKELRIELAYQKERRRSKLEQGIDKEDATITSISNDFFRLHEEYESLIQQLNEEYPDYYKKKFSISDLGIKTLQQSLTTKNQSLIEYFVGDSTIFIFLIQSDNYEIHQIKKDFPLNELVENLTKNGISHYYSLAANKQSRKEEAIGISNYTTAAQVLYTKLILPIQGKLTKELIIVPDGILGYVPFETLLKENPKRVGAFASYPFMLYDHQISYCYSANLLREMKGRKHREETKTGVLAVAPFYQGDISTIFSKIDTVDLFSLRDSLNNLPASGEEIAAIKKIMGGETCYGKNASIQKFQEQADQYRILHLSTHGKANDQVGDYSYLAFGMPTKDNNFEKLYARDLYNYSLNADMVVLSACETGIGKLQKGEGIISLSRAFAYAGTKSIFTTLWQVNDEKMRDLMISFYKNLKKGEPKDAALYHAKLSYLKENKGAMMHPFFWAGMIGIGDMSPL